MHANSWHHARCCTLKHMYTHTHTRNSIQMVALIIQLRTLSFAQFRRRLFHCSQRHAVECVCPCSYVCFYICIHARARPTATVFWHSQRLQCKWRAEPTDGGSHSPSTHTFRASDMSKRRTGTSSGGHHLNCSQTHWCLRCAHTRGWGGMAHRQMCTHSKRINRNSSHMCAAEACMRSVPDLVWCVGVHIVLTHHHNRRTSPPPPFLSQSSIQRDYIVNANYINCFDMPSGFVSTGRLM